MGGVRSSGLFVVLLCAAAMVLPATASADYAATVLADSPRVYLPLDERSGTTFANLGSDGGTAELVGEIPADAQVGAYGAIESDEPSDRSVRLSARNLLEIRPDAGSRLDGPYTLEGWTKLEAHVSYLWGGLPSYGHLYGGSVRLWFERLWTAMQDNPFFTWPGAYFGAVGLGDWHHIAMTWRAPNPGETWGEVALFIDGVHAGSYGVSRTEFTVYSDTQRLTAGNELYGWIDELAVYDYVLPADRIAEHHARGRNGFGAPPPANTTAPRPVGAAVVGRTARCDEGVWTGGPRTFSFRWLRDGAPIDRATRQAYVLSADDVNHDVTCEVVAHNIAGSSAPLVSPTAISMTAAAPADYRATVLADNPRVYLPLDERSGTTFTSLGSDGGTAEMVGQVADAEVGAYGAIESDEPSDRSLRLSGRQALEIRPRAGSRLDGAYTLEGWTKLETHVFHEWGPNYAHLFGGTTRLWFEGHLAAYQDIGGFTWGQALWATISLREWHHVALTWRPYTRDDGYGQIDLYVDGVHSGSRATSQSQLTVYSDALRLTAGNQAIGWIDELAVYDYELTPERISEHHRRGAEGFGAPAPTNTTLPKPVGEAVVGKSARCDEGVWSGGPRTFFFRWLRDGAPIDRATRQRYVLSADDLNHDITCEVVAHNRAGDSAAVASTDAIAMPRVASPDSYREMVLQENPRVYLPLDERSGTTFGNLGTDGGTAELVGQVQDAEVGAYGALESDETTDRAIRMSGRQALEIRPRAGSRLDGEYTLEGWTKLDTHVFHEWGPNYAHLFGGTTRLWFEGHLAAYQDIGGFAWGQALWGTISLREWHHVALTWRPYTRDDGYGEINLYVDGVNHGARATSIAQLTVYSDALRLSAGPNTIGLIDELAVYDYELSPERIAEHHDRGRNGFGAPAPENSTPPEAIGDPVVGRTATCNEGEWTGGPRVFAFRWLRDGAPISGATERTYTLSGDDLGHEIACAVVATNAAGDSAEERSTSTITLPGVTIGRYRDVVMADNPVVYLPFTDVTGRETPNLGRHGGRALNPYSDVRSVGGALNGDDDPGLAVDSYWLELHPDAGSRVAGDFTVEGWTWMEFPSGGTLFGGWAQTAFYPTYTRLLSDTGLLGHRLSAQAWHHVALVMRAQTRDRGGAVDLYVDGVLHGSLGVEGSKLLYDDANRLGMAMSIPGAVDELAVYDYRLTPERIDLHHRMGRDGVEPPYPIPTTPPHVSGEGRVGSTLTCEPATWTGSPTSFEYRWTRDGAVIAGADADTYVVTTADGATSVACAMRATNTSGTSDWEPSDNGVAVAPVPRNVSPPAVTGNPWPGERVTCATGVWLDGETPEVRWQLDGPDVAGLPGDQYDITGPEGGRLRCLVRMTGPGGTSDWVPSETVVIDGTPPTVDLTCPASPVLAGASATATFVASDGGAGLATPPTGSVPLDTSTIGTFTARTIARDAAGHETEGTCLYRVVHPGPGAPEPDRGVSADGSLGLTWPAQGAPDAPLYELQAREAGDSGWTDVATTTARAHDFTATLADGTWTFRVRAVGGDFDDAWSPASAPVIVDRTPPAIDLTCPTGTLSIGDPAQATFTASDAGSGLVTPPSGTLTLDTSAPGTYTARSTARDAAGHETEGTCTYRVAYGGPGAPALSGGHTSPTDDGAIQLTWPAQGAPDAARYVLEKRDADDPAGAWTSVASPTSRTYDFATALGEGTWTFRVRADDPAFETAWSPDSQPVVIDLTAPTASVVASSPNPVVVIGTERWYRGEATLTVTATDPALADTSAGSGLVASSVPAPATRTTTGALTLGAPAVADAAGNTRSVPTETVWVDADAPRVTVSCPTAMVARGAAATATWTANDGTGESGLATPAAGTLTLDTSTPGTHSSPEVVSRDNVGNETRESCTYRVAFPDVDWEKPLNEKKPVAVPAGTTVPLSFTFKDRTTHGTSILSGPDPVVTTVDCGNGNNNPKTIAPVTDPANRLTLTGGVYTWTLPVAAGWAGTCRQVEFTLTDGTKHSVVLIVV